MSQILDDLLGVLRLTSTRLSSLGHIEEHNIQNVDRERD